MVIIYFLKIMDLISLKEIESYCKIPFSNIRAPVNIINKIDIIKEIKIVIISYKGKVVAAILNRTIAGIKGGIWLNTLIQSTLGDIKIILEINKGNIGINITNP